MDICIIAPRSALKYAKLSKRHLALTQVDPPSYMRFYMERSRESKDFVILDNGAYEGHEVDYDNYLGMIDYYDPDVVVLPDFPNRDGKETFAASMEFAIKLGEGEQQMMYVPQALPGIWSDFYRWLDTALVLPFIEWVGISKLLKQTFLHSVHEHTRVDIANYIKRRRDDVKLHALGMWDGSVSELKLCRASGLFESLDTSAPVWRGICGSYLDDPRDQREWEEKGPPMDFSYTKPITDEQHKRIMHNLEVIGVDTSAVREP